MRPSEYRSAVAQAALRIYAARAAALVRQAGYVPGTHEGLVDQTVAEAKAIIDRCAKLDIPKECFE